MANLTISVAYQDGGFMGAAEAYIQSDVMEEEATSAGIHGIAALIRLAMKRQKEEAEKADEPEDDITRR